MNFADKTRAGLNQNKSRLKKAEEAMDNWKKQLSVNDISNVIKETAARMAEELEDPSVMLFGIVINLEIVDRLFPQEEFEKYMESQASKGDE